MIDGDDLDPKMPPGYFLQYFDVCGGMVCVPTVCAHLPEDQAEAIRLAWAHYEGSRATVVQLHPATIDDDAAIRIREALERIERKHGRV